MLCNMCDSTPHEDWCNGREYHRGFFDGRMNNAPTSSSPAYNKGFEKGQIAAGVKIGLPNLINRFFDASDTIKIVEYVY